MRFPHLVLWILAASVFVTAAAEAQELRATYNGQFVQVQLDGSYPQYIVQRAESVDGEFDTLEYNRTGCTGQCTYYDYEAQLDQAYLYRIIVEMPDGGQRVFGPTSFSLDTAAGLALHTVGAPNPMKDLTRISWVVPAAIARAGDVRTVLTIHDPAGREVNRLWERAVPVGAYEVEWNGEDGSGHQLPTGSYFYRVQVGSKVEVGRLVLLKQ